MGVSGVKDIEDPDNPFYVRRMEKELVVEALSSKWIETIDPADCPCCQSEEDRSRTHYQLTPLGIEILLAYVETDSEVKELFSAFPLSVKVFQLFDYIVYHLRSNPVRELIQFMYDQKLGKEEYRMKKKASAAKKKKASKKGKK